MARTMAHLPWPSRRSGPPLPGRRERTRGPSRLAAALGLGALLAVVALGACGQDAAAAAQSAKAQLDRELLKAHTALGVPDGLLQPLETRDRTVAAGASRGTDQTYTAAASVYAALYDQVVAIERMTPEQARAQAQADLAQLDAALADVQKAGFVEAGRFQQHRQSAQQQLIAAASTADYFAADRYIEDQTAALRLISPVYRQLQSLTALVDAQNAAFGIPSLQPQPLQCARGDGDAYFWPNPYLTLTPPAPPGSPTYAYQQWPAQDLAAFRAAGTAGQYQALATLMSAQAQQLGADATLAAAPQAQRLVQQFQADVQFYQQQGGKDGSFQQQAAHDAQTLDAAETVADFTALVQTVQRQRQAFAFPLLKAQTQADMQTLRQLVNRAQGLKTIDPANGVGYPDGYEYASANTGIGDAQARLAYAQTPDDFQVVDEELQMFIANIQAMLQNLGDTTPSDKPHQTDLSLLRHYGLTGTRVMVVSLREQVARFYDGGQLVKAVKVTTGNPDLPSPPGVHCVLRKLQNYDDISPFPKDSPYYYKPTHINYGMVYSDYGYIVHDAWWRSWFGKYSNLPHYEPIAFNNGSHGCVNLPLSAMPWVFNWSSLGTPVLVY